MYSLGYCHEIITLEETLIYRLERYKETKNEQQIPDLHREMDVQRLS